MAYRQTGSQFGRSTGQDDHQYPPGAAAAFMWRLQNRQRPSPGGLGLGLMVLAISGGVLLLLTGVTMTATFMALIFFSPFLFITSPIWIPFAAVAFFAVAGFLSMFGFGVLAVAAVAWVYRYYRGLNPPGSDRVDYARTRLVDTAGQVKDYAREYGGYLQSKVKDAAPGA